MARCPSLQSNRSFFDDLLDFWLSWQITILMLITMSLQTFLVVAGFFRKHTSSPLLHATVWLAFLSIDVVAIYALGLMLGSGCDNVFSLYAPLLLFHLGATDCINAYSPADNDLWRRYCFKMTLEIIAAAYIVSKSSDCPNYTTCGAILFVVGAFKYGERTYSLWCGSQAQILATARPVYKLMSVDPPPNYEKPENDGDWSKTLLVSGAQKWYERYMKAETKIEDVPQAVTFKDIQQCQRLLRLMSFNVLEDVCLAYALFKIYRRRLTNLRIHHKEEDYRKVGQLLCRLEAHRIRVVIDLELSFIFDGVFSKAASGLLYQGIGFVSRLASAILLLIALLDLIVVDVSQHNCREDMAIHLGLGLANLLVVVAIFIECLQIFKLVRSNWMRVWLACNYIKEQRLAGFTTTTTTRTLPGDSCTGNGPRKLHSCLSQCILCAFRYVGKPKASHWNFKLEQQSILADTVSAVFWHYVLHRTFEFGALCRLQTHQLEIINLLGDLRVELVQEHLIGEVLSMFKPSEEAYNNVSVKSPSKLIGLWERISKQCRDLGLKTHTSLERTVLNLHLFTSVFEMDLLQRANCVFASQQQKVKVSIALSRYCLHLMLKRPKLMPEDPEVARGLYNTFKQELKDLFLSYKNHPDSKKKDDLEQNVQSSRNVCDGATEKLKGDLFMYTVLLKGQCKDGLAIHTAVHEAITCLGEWVNVEGRWKLLANVWADIMIYIVLAAENAQPHTEQMAKGGELLTHLWVLLGHLGGARYMDTS